MSTSRRGFLTGVLGTGAAATVLPGCAPDVDPAPVVDVTPDAETGAVTLEVSRYPDLARVGGAVTLRQPGLKPLLVVHRTEEGFSVLDATCTHKGCPLGYDGRDVVCPCHAARFDSETGAVKLRPATAALEVVASTGVTYEAGVLTIQLGDADFPPALNGTVTLPYSEFPELRDNGGSVTGVPRGYGRPIIVSREPGGTLVAVNALCTHNRCRVGLEEDHLRCPCHGATFNLDGTMRQGPVLDGNGTRGTTPPLMTLTVTETDDGDGVIVSGLR
ncbi:Rieske 2Fe-2S domain-containing protein [Pyxidicoccus parkwayensis]|uniref:Rieske 2Fe-2S domain-containing protein n=1 Tax=Pyxidicoccus parkwayensis TaxID=2813578 RepID=A0ABX7P0L2_9BACT|nr:Rieske 2Fe-2S domain-containing protein [Pyxidicoccus parkwaysis]QSQ23209.1 Rieske 2Fe-2S domain-containing protein [Pyxidicoccus parkwaysis]